MPNLNMAYQMAQLSQMMNQNMPQQFQNSGNDIQGQDINLLNNLALLQMMNNGGFGDVNTMMNNVDNNNQDSSQ